MAPSVGQLSQTVRDVAVSQGIELRHTTARNDHHPTPNVFFLKHNHRARQTISRSHCTVAAASCSPRHSATGTCGLQLISSILVYLHKWSSTHIVRITDAGCLEFRLARTPAFRESHRTRDVIFRKKTNRNQTDTNQMTTTETKYQTNFILPKNTNIQPKFYKIILKIPIKYQENTQKFGTEIPNSDLVLVFSWYAKFLLPIDITSSDQQYLSDLSPAAAAGCPPPRWRHRLLGTVSTHVSCPCDNDSWEAGQSDGMTR